ncbi:hypothetical protein IAG44_18430 [Streptomyces roseirectus]|uniref:Uncharacterized protein n=1 Tax=Streptomyces roseirectus TaxID=2768066 RepID=A0A7H0IEK5_9ACTN|nr:hypothetical protein [Streptomyces roseirectus]QNP71221.1 hypothetical protein IAG44_18430 [Streptomyces roseirectus]
MHYHGYLWTGSKDRFDDEALRRPPHPEPPPTPLPNDLAGQRLLHRYREVAAEFPTSDLPPIEPAHWLLKPKSVVQGTWTDPEEITAWLARQLTEYAPRFASDRHRTAAQQHALVDSAAARLRAGNDIALGFYLERPAYLHLALIVCSPNSSRPELPCPAPQMR